MVFIMMPFAPTIVYGVDSMPTELVVGDTTVILDGTVVTSNGTGWSYDSSINMLSITAEANFSEESGKGIYVDGDLNIEMDNVTIDLFTVEGGIPLTIHSGDVNLTLSGESVLKGFLDASKPENSEAERFIGCEAILIDEGASL